MQLSKFRCWVLGYQPGLPFPSKPSVLCKSISDNKKEDIAAAQFMSGTLFRMDGTQALSYTMVTLCLSHLSGLPDNQDPPFNSTSSL
jgi:hypothetical protein